MNNGVSVLFDIINSYNIMLNLAFPKQADYNKVSEQISELSKYGKYCQYCSTTAVIT